MTAGERNLAMCLAQMDGRIELDEIQANDLWFALNFDKPEACDLQTLIKYHRIRTFDAVVDAAAEALWKLYGVPQFLSKVTIKRELLMP